MRRTSLLTRGYLTLHALVFGAIGLIIVGAIVSWGAVSQRSAALFGQREEAFQVAEAGIEYYRWHLAHAPTDFKDGQSGPGPYLHPYDDKDGNQIGMFTLTITPPPVGSTVVKVVSKGEVATAPGVSRSIEATLAIPSLAKFAVAANAPMRFGQGTEVFGPIHSNDGIRFDGIAHNLVTSAKTSYDDPDHTGPDEFGVHTHVNPPPGSGVDESYRPAEMPPATVPVRTDVFVAGRQFPVPAVDWNGFTTDLANLKTAAQASGRYFSSSGRSGYLLTLKTNDTFDLAKVTSLTAVPGSCDDPGNQSGWGSWSVNATQSYLTNQAFPTNGLLFFEDNVWVEGQINTARLTIAVGTFPDSPSTNKNITVNHDLKYTNYDGRDIIGLIAQGNLNVGMNSSDTLRLDAALVAKNGRVGRYYYESPGCAPYDHRSAITLYGMIGTKDRYGFAYTDNTGYATRTITYDANLLYGPPPSFPLTSDSYQVISWREL